MNGYGIDTAPAITIVSPAELEVERKTSAGEVRPCAPAVRAHDMAAVQHGAGHTLHRGAVGQAEPIEPIAWVRFTPPDGLLPELHAENPSTPDSGSATSDGGARADEAPGPAEISTLLRQLEGRPVDAPDLDDLSRFPPQAVMDAAAQVGAEEGTPRRVLQVVVDFLAAKDLTPQYPPRKFGRKPRGRPVLDPWLTALTKRFFTPDILDAAENRYLQLTSGVESVRNPVRALTPDGRPMPRKRDLDEAGNPVIRGRLDHSVSLADSEDAWETLARRYPRFMLALGEHHHHTNSEVNTYECMARAMLLDFDVWREQQDRLYEMFLDAATFMVLSAHKTDQVMALYDQVPLRLNDLQRRIVDQIERRTEIYTRARAEYSNNAAISQALGDLLNTLIEDPSIDELLPPDEKRRFLVMIGEAAVARRRYQEAVGVYASLGDSRRLRDIGRRLSANIYYVNRGTVTISRDIDTAIDAFREAGDTESLRELLARCEAVRDQFAGQEKPANYQYLEQYIRSIRDFVAPADYAKSLGLEELSAGVERSIPGAAGMSAERLPDLIAQYLQQVETAVPGQDLAEVRDHLKTLGERALELGMYELAVKALEASGSMTVDERLDLAHSMVKAGHYQEAFDIYAAVGERAYPDLVELGTTIVSRGLAPRGILNPDVEIAVDAFLITDESARLEALLNDLLKLRVRFATLEMDALSAGRAPVDRNADVIERCLQKIGEVYDLVGIPARPGAREGDTSGTTPASQAVAQEGGGGPGPSGATAPSQDRAPAATAGAQDLVSAPPEGGEASASTGEAEMVSAPPESREASAPTGVVEESVPSEEGVVQAATPSPGSAQGDGASGHVGASSPPESSHAQESLGETSPEGTVALNGDEAGVKKEQANEGGGSRAGGDVSDQAAAQAGPAPSEPTPTPTTEGATPTPVPIPTAREKRATSIYRPVLEP